MKKARYRIFSTATPQRGPWRLSQKQISSLLKLKISERIKFFATWELPWGGFPRRQTNLIPSL